MSQASGEQLGRTAPYRVLARKYRPSDFSALIGQEPMVRTLTNAFASGRIAQAWMLTGVRGVGKTTTARILARALNYKTAEINQPSIDLAALGEHCKPIMEGRHVDVIEMDAASHTGIDDIRDIIEQVRYAPVSARYKVYIIDEVHMLSTQAFNGLLKTLEEPPPHVKFIFATTEIRKVPITVLSRTQRFDLRRVEAGLLVQHLQRIAGLEEITAEDQALAMIARAAEGSVRDALSILDQAIAHGDGMVTAEAVRAMLGLADRARIVDLFAMLMRGDAAAALAEFRAQYDAGADPVAVLTELAEFTHQVTRLKYVAAAAEDASLSEDERRRGQEFAASLHVRALSRAWQMLLKGIPEVQGTNRPLSAGEMVLIRIAHAADLPTLDEALRALEDGAALPAAKGNGAAAAAAGGAAPALSAPGPGLQALATGVQAPGSQAPGSSATGAQAPGTSQGSASVAHAGSKASSSAAVGIAPGPGAAAAEPSRAASAQPTQITSQRAAGPSMAGGQTMRLVESRPEPPVDQAPAPVVTEPAARPAITSLADIAALADQNRDMAFKVLVRRCLRMVRVEPGRLTISVTEDAPKTLLTDLTSRLQKWTGRPWLVALSREEGGQTLAEADASRRESAFLNARNDPTVAAIMARFPGARIIDVRIPNAPEAEPVESGAPVEPAPDDDEPN